MSLIEIENIEIFGIIYMRSKINYIFNIPDLYKLVFNILKFHNLIT